MGYSNLKRAKNGQKLNKVVLLENLFRLFWRKPNIFEHLGGDDSKLWAMKKLKISAYTHMALISGFISST